MKNHHLSQRTPVHSKADTREIIQLIC